jgi:hypothetical protein
MDTFDELKTQLAKVGDMINNQSQDVLETPAPVGFVEVDYDRVNPHKFLDNLGANAAILGATYRKSQPVLSDKCDKIIGCIIELEKLIGEVHM